MRQIVIARHGETAWNALGRLQGHTDVELNDVGRAQARALVTTLADANLVSVITSDLARARETGEIVAAGLGLPAPVIDLELRERAFGVFEGLTREQCAADHPDAWREWLAHAGSPPGAELIPDATARMTRALARIAAADGGPVLVVSHGGVMRLWLLGVLAPPIPPLANGATYVVDHDPVRARPWG